MLKKLLYLLFAGIPLMTGVAFAEITNVDVFVPNNLEGDKKVSLSIGTFDGKTIANASYKEIDSKTGETKRELLTSSTVFKENVSSITAEIIAANTMIGAINSATEEKSIIKELWVPSDFPVGIVMREQAINADSLVFDFEGFTNSEGVYSEPFSLSQNHEFDKTDYVRAIANIRGMAITGPTIALWDDSGTEQTSQAKKMQAAYALIGQVIASRTAWFTGSWDGRETLRIPDSALLFDRRSGSDETRATFLGQDTDLIDYTGTSSEGTVQFREVTERVIDFLKKVMIPIAIILVAYGGISLFLSFQDEEKMTKTIKHLTGILVGFLAMSLAVHFVDWVIFGTEGQILRGEVDTAEFAQRGFEEISGLFDMFTAFAVIIAVAFLVYNAVTLILAGGEDEGQISEIKKRILYSMIGIILLVSIEPVIEVFTTRGQLTMPEIRGVVSLVAKWLNFFLGFVGVLAVVAIIYAGIQMIIHFGDDTQIESAKNIMKAAALGLILAFSSWAIVYFFVFAG